MTTTVQPTVLVVDDDPTVAWSIRTAVPTWRVLDAADGAEGMALVRAERSALNVVVLDVQMPHDGILTGVQLRSEFPDLPILPLTGAAEAIPMLRGMGCLSPLLKPVATDTLTNALHHAIGAPPPPPFTNLLLPYMLRTAAQSEGALAAARPTQRVALFGSSTLLCTGMRATITVAGGAVRTEATSTRILRQTLAGLRVSVLVADSALLPRAAIIAQEFKLPLLIVALTMTAGYRASAYAQGVVVEPTTPATMAEALTAVIAGHSYRDPALDALFRESALTEAEQKVARLLVHGKDATAITHDLALQPQTLRVHLTRIYHKLGVDSPEQVRAWADAWPHRAE